MDELDNKIIQILQEDGRASNARIAREVGVSEGTVRRRLRRLILDNVIKVVAVPSLDKLGFSTAALIGIQADPGRIDEVADALAKLDEVHYIAVTTGAFDIFAWVALRSSQELGNFLRNKIGTVPGPSST